MADSSGDRHRAENAESEWLVAGKRGDVQRLRELQLRHPERLALDRVSDRVKRSSFRCVLLIVEGVVWVVMNSARSACGRRTTVDTTWPSSSPHVECLTTAGCGLFLTSQTFDNDHRGRGDDSTYGQRLPRTRASDWSGFPLHTLGASAMHAATWSGSLDVMRFLLEQGQHPDSRDDWEMTPLMVITMRHTLPFIRRVFHGRETILRHLVMDVRACMCTPLIEWL
jgi:hypothetical protein